MWEATVVGEVVKERSLTHHRLIWCTLAVCTHLAHTRLTSPARSSGRHSRCLDTACIFLEKSMSFLALSCAYECRVLGFEIIKISVGQLKKERLSTRAMIYLFASKSKIPIRMNISNCIQKMVACASSYRDFGRCHERHFARSIFTPHAFKFLFSGNHYGKMYATSIFLSNKLFVHEKTVISAERVELATFNEHDRAINGRPSAFWSRQTPRRDSVHDLR